MFDFISNFRDITTLEEYEFFQKRYKAYDLPIYFLSLKDLKSFLKFYKFHFLINISEEKSWKEFSSNFLNMWGILSWSDDIKKKIEAFLKYMISVYKRVLNKNYYWLEEMNIVFCSLNKFCTPDALRIALSSYSLIDKKKYCNKYIIWVENKKQCLDYIILYEILLNKNKNLEKKLTCNTKNTYTLFKILLKQWIK